MLGPVDATIRPLKIPPKFISYMEKHRIYELFEELATSLIIKKPSDHILYLKQSLRLAAKKRDLPRVIILGEPYSEILVLAGVLEKEMSLKLITLKDICDVSPEIPEERITEENIVKNLNKLLRESVVENPGWILVDLPRTKPEAQAFQRGGIMPTHVIEILSPPINRCQEDIILDRERNLRDLRQIFHHILLTVDPGTMSVQELTESCFNLLKRKKCSKAPSIFRAVLIGARGSGCRNAAKKICQRFNLVYVDFHEILEKTLKQKNPLAESIRKIEFRWGKKLNPDGRIRVVENYLLNDDCLKKGWILTGYPINIEDFKLLDNLPTSPNRVVFVIVEKCILRNRLINRRYDIITGEKINEYDNLEERKFFTRPEDKKQVVNRDIEEFERNIDSLIKYAGESASIVNGNCEERNLRERIEACLIRPPLLCAGPRISKPKGKSPEIEYDPDDEPDHRILDGIRETESLLSLV